MEIEGAEIVKESSNPDNPEVSKDTNCESQKFVQGNDQGESENSAGKKREDAIGNQCENKDNDICIDIDDKNHKSSECGDRENESKSPTKECISVKNEISREGKWVIRTYTGYIVTLTVHPDRDRPDNFETERARMMWDTATEINLKRMKHQVRTGEYIPDDAIVEVDPDPLRVPERFGNYSVGLESDEQRREKVEERNNKKISILERELELVGLMLNIRECFSGVHQLEEGLTLLEEVSKLDITSLMLKKNPFVVNTVYCLCNYAGMDEQLLDDDHPNLNDIRSKAKEIYDKFQSLYTIPDNFSFEEYYKIQRKLLWKILGYNTQKACELVNDPTSMF